MKNKIKWKKYILKTIILSILLLVVFLGLNRYEYHTYTKSYNNKIASLVSILQKEYPKLTEKEIMEILSQENDFSTKNLKKYGIDIEKDSILKENDKNYYTFVIVNLLFFIGTIGSLLGIYMKYNNQKEKELKEIITYIDQINHKNYELQIDSISEDELSILKNEIYKTTILLKESAENSKKDKRNLKNSLEDISHQLKTPLTSILIMLDNLIENPEMDPSIREEFLHDIRRNVININFLVQNILKLSKLDSNTIEFERKEESVKEILKESIQNVSTLSDLKNIEIVCKVKGNPKIVCDKKWQVESLTNLLKNSVEHSKENGKITITIEENNIYLEIDIKDNGEGISKKDLPHIFERFYKGENASSESIGIGLALAKSIVEEDNGKISVESSNKGTTFQVKYYKL